MYCGMCQQHKRPQAFWSVEYQRHVAHCDTCRASRKLIEMDQNKATMPRTTRHRDKPNLADQRNAYNRIMGRREQPNIGQPRFRPVSIKFVIDQLRERG